MQDFFQVLWYICYDIVDNIVKMLPFILSFMTAWNHLSL